MEKKQFKKNKFPQRNGNFSLDDYYNALKYRNLDRRMEELAWGIIRTIDRIKKSGKSKSQEGLLKSILGECLEVTKSWNDNKLELYVTSINIPDNLKPAFLPANRCSKIKSSNTKPTKTLSTPIQKEKDN